MKQRQARRGHGVDATTDGQWRMARGGAGGLVGLDARG
jgi:hypothetical protein